MPTEQHVKQPAVPAEPADPDREAQYAALAAALRDKMGAAAEPVLGSLVQLYAEHAVRLHNLKTICSQHGINWRTVVVVAAVAAVAAVPAVVEQPAVVELTVEQTAAETSAVTVDEQEKQPAKPRGEPGKFVQRADPRGRNWKKREHGAVNTDIFKHYGRLPSYVTPEIRQAMPEKLHGPYRECLYEADWDGRFVMPAGTLAKQLKKSRWRVQLAMDCLLAAGIIEVLFQGSRVQATVYQLAPWRTFKPARALRAIAAFREGRKQALADWKDKKDGQQKDGQKDGHTTPAGAENGAPDREVGR